MNNVLYSGEDLEFMATPLLRCPRPGCFHGSSELTNLAMEKDIWSIVKCRACGVDYEIAEAIDEGFANNCWGCYSLWANGSQIARQIVCETGKTTLIDVRNIFEEIYYIYYPGAIGHGEYLAGGLWYQYVPQGFVMVGIAPNSDGTVISNNLLIFIEGRKHSQPDLLPWQQMLLQAKLNLFSAPKLTVIMSVSAVDLYLEHLTSEELTDQRRRLSVWSQYINKKLKTSLKNLLGKVDYKQVEKFVNTRNALAHKGNYLEELPQEVREREERWLKTGKISVGDANFSPCANFALRCALKIIRECRRIESQQSF